jgi:hypothetical protein
MKKLILLPVLIMIFTSCSNTGNKKQELMKKEFAKGTYGYDVDFFTKHNIEALELKDSAGASVLIVPGYQGRVMTSTSGGPAGKSYGWINYKHIESGKLSKQFNPFGGEERFWLGPEGGPFSIYFQKGYEQVFANWKVPAELDTDTFKITSIKGHTAVFSKEFSLVNASGTKMDVEVERTVKLLDRTTAGEVLGMGIDNSLSFVAYESSNTIINKGRDWNKESGFLSIWLLGMFNPSENGVVFIPYRKTGGKAITDDYFGKVPADRLVVKENILFFKVDGKHRSKIGIAPDAALPWCGSYDPDNRCLTLLNLSLPEKPMPYVNSKWGKQDDPLKGDAVNSYNDGPVEDGSIMGPFYEIESSSPAAILSSGGSITHTQRTFHISGDEAKLNEITMKLFGVGIEEIKAVF